jgi:hypothetical protein
MRERAVADTLVLPKQLELTPALQNLIETVIPSGSHCLNVGRRARALNVWLTRHGCTQVTADESHMPALPLESASFDAALLVGVLDRLTQPYVAARQLHRVLRPGGVLLVTAANDCYWRRRLDRVVGGEDRRSSSYTPRPRCAGCCSTPASASSGSRDRTAPSSATSPSPAASPEATARPPTGSPSGSSRPCSGRAWAPSRSGSEAAVFLVGDRDRLGLMAWVGRRRLITRFGLEMSSILASNVLIRTTTSPGAGSSHRSSPLAS